MPKYRTSEATKTITLAKPKNTTTTIEVRGSEDGYAAPRTDFSSEEEIRVNGTVTATDGSDLSTTGVEIYIDGAIHSTTQLTFQSGTNQYIQSLGTLPEGTTEVKVVFPEFRTFTSSTARLNMSVSSITGSVGTWWALLSLGQKLAIGAGLVAVIAGVGYYLVKRKKK